MSSNPNNQMAISSALTLATSTQQNESIDQPRQPRNLQGLLRFAMEATKREDPTRPSTHTALDPERRQFLENALRSLTVDIIEVLRNAIQVLSDVTKVQGIGPSMPQEVDEAFDNILEIVDDIDAANDFHKVGGFSIFPACYGSDCDLVRERASSVLAELCQNNPYCQARTLESGFLEILLHMCETESGNPLTKALYALSCTCREYPPACTKLIKENGCKTLSDVLTKADGSARTKAVFFINYLCQHYDEAKDQFIKSSLIKNLVNNLREPRSQSTEHVLSLLLTLIEGQSGTKAGANETILGQCRQERLEDVLERHLSNPELQDEAFKEEKDYSLRLLQILKDDISLECDR